MLRDKGLRYERHSSHFRPGTPDAEWLPFVGRNGWALLTSDRRIRYRALEKQAVQQHAIAMFYFAVNNLSGKQMAFALTAGLPAMQRMFAE